MRTIEQEHKILSMKHGKRTYFYVVNSSSAGMKYVTGAFHSLGEAQLKLREVRRRK